MNNFKKIKILSLFTLVVVLYTGCNKDLLKTTPNDRLSSDIFWKTEEDATFAANGVYTYLDQVSSFFSWDALTDIGHVNRINSGQETLIERGQYDGTFTRILNEWTRLYAGIRSANSFLANVDQVKTTNQALIDRLKGEVRVLRSYYYIRLASLYGDVPLVITSISLEESRNLTRTPVAQVWDFISKELTEAAILLPTVHPEKGKITKGAALALKARAMLYAGRYQQVIDASKQVMDLNVYNLYPSYENLFSYAAENNLEVIFDIQFIKTNYSNNVFQLIGPWSQQNSGSNYVPTKKLVDSYQMKNGKNITDPTSGFNVDSPYTNRDPRLKYSIFTLGDILPDGKVYNSKKGSGTPDAVDFSFFSTSTGFNVKKYINKEDYAQPANGGINIILMRYADVLLMYAEAKIEANQIDQSVLDAINKVRQRPDVNMPMITAFSQEELRNIVRQERLVEFAFEGLRYFDIRRWKIAEDIIPGKVYGMTYRENGTLITIDVAGYNKVFNKNRDYLWPIPQRER
ncbi:MAG: RagB/SusD family nutrient uptake outer membrane protein, partial [Segetibacter sp.]